MPLPNEDQRSEPIRDFLNLASAQQLDPVLDSIQTLRKLAQDISQAEIVETDTKAKQLLQHLSSLKKELNYFKEIKLRLMEIKRTGRVDLKKRTSPRSYSGNIIPFPTAFRAGDAISPPGKTIPEPPRISPADETSTIEEPAGPDREEFAVDSTLSRLEDLLKEDLFLKDVHGEREEENAKAHESIDPLLEVADANIAAVEADRPLPTGAEETLRRDPLVDIERPDMDPLEPAAASSVARQPTEPAQSEGATPNRSSGSEPLQEEVEFDQSLLKELIKDYGEFDSYSNISGGVVSNETKAVAPISPEMRAAEKLPEILNKPEIMGKRADFDVEVKELIRSYGKVDIYSTQNDNWKRNLKKTLLAGAVLVAVFAGSYFFIFRDNPEDIPPQGRSAPSSWTGSPQSTQNPAPKPQVKSSKSELDPSREGTANDIAPRP